MNKSAIENMEYKGKILGFIFILLLGFKPKAQEILTAIRPSKSAWVELTLEGMTLDEKIGQLMMVRAHSDKGPDHIAAVKKLVTDYHVGSMCFFQGTPLKQAELTNEYQQLSRIPLLIAIDGEWGLGMRFKKDVISYPRQLTLGAIGDNSLIYEMGKQVAFELKRIGVHLNFAPVVDINNNPNNPVINTRSFGENKYNVSAKSYEYMRGMQDAGLIACAKHFPGHGDTDLDSHYDLPTIPYSYKRLDSLELYPFRTIIKNGVKSVMIAHLHVPSLDKRKNRPTSLSEHVIKDILRDSMGFKGLVITDGMEMEGVTKHFAPGVAEAEAILAGNDIICLPRDVPLAVKAIKNYVEQKKISISQLDASVTRILETKYDLGLDVTPRILLNDLESDILHKEGQTIQARLLENAITLAVDTGEVIPFRNIQKTTFATIAFGAKTKTVFQNRIDSYVDAMHLQLSYNPSSQAVSDIYDILNKVDQVIVSTEDMSSFASKNYNLSTTFRNVLNQIAKIKPITLVVFGSPYSLKYFDEYPTVMVSYTDDSIMQDKTAQAIFGAIDIRGRLPITASEKYRYGQGEQRANLARFGFSSPEEVGMKSDSLNQINGIIDEMIQTKASPGCQILIAKDGKVIWNRAYGTHDYVSNHPVKLTDVYDLASITKIAASTISLMKLYDQGKLDIDGTLQPFVMGIDTSNKKDITIRDMMAHHAGLIGWIPFYKQTIDPKSKTKKPLDKYYRSIPTDSFNIQVASNLYMRNDYVDSVWMHIIHSELRDNTNYKYSDLGFYLMMKVIEKQTGMTLDKYADVNLYQPLGLRRTAFKPREKFKLDEIVPSEKDNYFRNQVIQGYVHDMGAAMIGGVSGHAGLFSNSYEIGIIMQMLLNGGYYGGISYFKPKTVLEFTTRYSKSTRRGIGFDMKELDPNRHENMSNLASNSTFGHLGFTGTCAFADPENNLVYVFISNRTYPSMENNKFINKNYRPRVQSVIYNSIEKPAIDLLESNKTED